MLFSQKRPNRKVHVVLALAYSSFNFLCTSKNNGMGRKGWKISSLQNSLHSLSLGRERVGLWRVALETPNTSTQPTLIQLHAIPYHVGSAKNHLQQSRNRLEESARREIQGKLRSHFLSQSCCGFLGNKRGAIGLPALPILWASWHIYIFNRLTLETVGL